MLGKHGFFNCMYQICTLAYISVSVLHLPSSDRWLQKCNSHVVQKISQRRQILTEELWLLHYCCFCLKQLCLLDGKLHVCMHLAWSCVKSWPGVNKDAVADRLAFSKWPCWDNSSSLVRGCTFRVCSLKRIAQGFCSPRFGFGRTADGVVIICHLE